MSDNLRMIIDNLHDSAVLTATSEALPVSYTQRSGRAYVWRSEGTSDQVILASLDRPKHLNAVVIYRHNLSSSATARIELLNKGIVVRDTGLKPLADLIPLGLFRAGIDAWGATYNDKIPVTVSTFWFPTTTVTGYRITLSDANSAGYLQVGRVIAGLSFSPLINPSYGLTLEWRETVQHRRTEGGSVRSIGEGLARYLSFDLDAMTEADRTKMTTELVKRGKSADVFISVYPEQGGVKEVEHAFLARRDTDYSHVHNSYKNWRGSMAFLEV